MRFQVQRFKLNHDGDSIVNIYRFTLDIIRETQSPLTVSKFFLHDDVNFIINMLTEANGQKQKDHKICPLKKMFQHF